MTGKGVPSLESPVRSYVVWGPCRFISALLVIMAAWVVCVQAKELPLHYYNLAQAARANYEHSLVTKRPDLINSYYNYAIATYEDYVRAYNAFYGQIIQQAIAAPNSDQVFSALQKDPGNIALNLRYAQLMEAEGAKSKALIAYQRTLRFDHNNAAAKEGLERTSSILGPATTKELLLRTKHDVDNGETTTNINSAKTTFSVDGGFRYATNASGRSDIIPRTDSPILNASGSILDERTLGKMHDFRLRTDLFVYSDLYLRDRDSDYNRLSLKVGPVFPLASNWQLALAPFGEINFLNYERFSDTGGASVSVENLQGHWLNVAELKLSRENFSSEFKSRNAAQAELSATLALYNLLRKGDYFFLIPGLKYNNAEQDRFRYMEPAVSAQYEIPFLKKLLFRANITYFSRFYDDSGVDVAGQQHDSNLTSKPSLAYKGFIQDTIDIVGSYSYEQNWSNDSTQQYDSHSAGVNLKWNY